MLHSERTTAACEAQPSRDVSPFDKGGSEDGRLEQDASGSDLDSNREPAEKLYDRSFYLAVLSQTCFVMANTLLAHYARWIEFLGGDLSAVGWIMGAGAAAGLVLRPWMAQAINRIGAKRSWGLGYFLFSLGAIANLWLVDLGPAIYLVRTANVLGAALVFASSLTYVSQTAPSQRRTEAIGILGVGGFFGMLVGPFLGDLFLNAEVRSREQFVLLFQVAAFANVLPGILLLFLKPTPHHTPSAPPSLGDFVDTVKRYWPGTILLVDFTFGVCMTAPFVFAASFIDDLQLRIAGVSELGFFFWCYAGPAIALRVGLRKLPDRIGARSVLLIGMLVMSLGMFTFCAVDSDRPWLLCLPALLCGVGHSLMFHTMTSLTLQPFPQEVHGTASALALMTLDLGMFLGAPILGVLGDYAGYGLLFASIGGLCIATAALYAWLE